MTDPKADKFPWIPPTALDILKNIKFINNKGDTITWDTIKDKEAVGIYFSAQWYETRLCCLSLQSLSPFSLVGVALVVLSLQS